MKVVNASKVAPPIEDLTLDAPVSAPNGSFCAPLYVGLAPAQTLGIQLGPAKTSGLVETAHVCYMDLELSPEQLLWVQKIETSIREQLPGHQTVWFTRDMQPADVNYFFDSSIHGNKLRAQVTRSQTFGTMDLHVFRESGELASTELISGNSNVLALVWLRGVAHRSGRTSLDWVVQQVMVMREAKCLIGLGDAEAEAAPAPAPAPAPQPAAPLPPPPPPPPAEAKKQIAKEKDGLEEVSMDAAELVPAIIPGGDAHIELVPESDLMAEELEEQIEMERERRAEALRIFMEANDLNPDDYHFPDTDEEDEEDEYEEGDAGEDAEVAPPSLGEIEQLA